MGDFWNSRHIQKSIMCTEFVLNVLCQVCEIFFLLYFAKKGNNKDKTKRVKGQTQRETKQT